MADRPLVDNDQIKVAIDDLRQVMKRRLEEKGRGAFLSRHEILGVIEEEYSELVGAVTEPEMAAVVDELLDVAVACIFGVACIKADFCDW